VNYTVLRSFDNLTAGETLADDGSRNISYLITAGFIAAADDDTTDDKSAKTKTTKRSK
jgi:hypothetical protein